MNQIPQAGEIYQHFKGKLYRIVTLATHTETGEQLVIYQALYGEFQVFAKGFSGYVSYGTGVQRSYQRTGTADPAPERAG